MKVSSPQLLFVAFRYIHGSAVVLKVKKDPHF